MADWDTSNPADNAVVSGFPANERAARAAAETVVGVEHVSAPGATQGRHLKATMAALGAAPAAAATEIVAYCKLVDGVPCLFVKDGVNGTELQITTPAGGFNVTVVLPATNLTVLTMAADTIAGLPVQLAIVGGNVDLDWSLGTSFSLTLNQNVTNFNFINMDAAQARSIGVEIINTGAFTIASFVPNVGWEVWKPLGATLAPISGAGAVTSYGCMLFPASRMHIFRVEMEEHV